jgi:hypothetical protein
MKNRFNFPCSAQLVRFKVANNIKKIKQSYLTLAKGSRATVLSSEYMKKAGYK